MKPEKDPSIEAKFDRIIESYGKFLRRAIQRVCPKDLGIQFDDIEQEARLKLWTALKSEREIENMSSYLYRIAATTTIDAMRRVRTRREDQFIDPGSDQAAASWPVAEDPGPSPEESALANEQLAKVKISLAKLSSNRRIVVSLHLRGLTNLEVAKALGWSEPKARNLIYRGLNDLRELLRESGIDLRNTPRD